SGTLAVNGELTSPVTVKSGSGSQVFGVGTIKGDVVNSGQLVPGPSGGFGSLTVTGNVNFASGSTLFINAGPTQASKLIVGGTAKLTGATVRVQALGNGSFAPSIKYPILTAAGGGLGLANNNTFSGVATTNLAFLKPTLSYDASDVFLTLCNSNISACSVEGT